MVASKTFETMAHNVWGALSPPNPAQENFCAKQNQSFPPT